jgi:hypothetical protein
MQGFLHIPCFFFSPSIEEAKYFLTNNILAKVCLDGYFGHLHMAKQSITLSMSFLLILKIGTLSYGNFNQKSTSHAWRYI